MPRTRYNFENVKVPENRAFLSQYLVHRQPFTLFILRFYILHSAPVPNARIYYPSPCQLLLTYFLEEIIWNNESLNFDCPLTSKKRDRRKFKIQRFNDSTIQRFIILFLRHLLQHSFSKIIPLNSNFPLRSDTFV